MQQQSDKLQPFIFTFTPTTHAAAAAFAYGIEGCMELQVFQIHDSLLVTFMYKIIKQVYMVNAKEKPTSFEGKGRNEREEGKRISCTSNNNVASANRGRK